MQNELSSAKDSALAPKPIKYRLACDRCQRSKIRCDQERPACRRCANRGMDCVYSPARRAGRPRTRNDANNNKSSSSAGKGKFASQTRQLTPVTEHCVEIPPAARSVPPSSPSGTAGSSATADDCTVSNVAVIPGLAPPIQLLSPEDMHFSRDLQSGSYFLQGLLGLTDSHGGGPKQIHDCDYDMFSDFHLSPELLDPSFCSAPAPVLWGLEHLPPLHNQHQDHQSPHQSEHRRDTIPSSTITSGSCTPSPEPFVTSCHCTSTLLDHLSTHSPPHSAPPSAFLTSKALLVRCRAAIACPNACRTRPSTALLVCECVDRALALFKLGNASLWTPASASPHEAAATSASGESPGGYDKGDLGALMLYGDEDSAPLRCGTLPIHGADRRAAMRTLLVRRMMDLLEMLESLRGALLEVPVDGGGRGRRNLEDEGVGGSPWELCADLVGEFAGKIADRVEAVRAHI